MLKYDTLYQSLKKISAEWHGGQLQWSYSWVYLKFYENGSCILDYIGDEQPVSINTWFNQTHPNISKGVFTMNDSIITISFNSKIKNEGQIQSDKIILRSYSDLNPVGTWDIFRIVH